MQHDCLSFQEIPNTSRLFLDYLAGDPKALQFYPAPSVLPKPATAHSPEHLKVICDVLADQNRRAGASAKTLGNIERIRSGSSVVVTGQQVGILGGPLLAILKTLSAIRVAHENNAVPVFWLATTDHDLAEIDHAYFLCDGELVRITADFDAQPGEIVSHARLRSSLLEQIKLCYPQADHEALSLLSECYAAGERAGIAFAKLWAKLFADYGLVLIDPDDSRLPTTQLLRAAAEKTLASNEALLARSREITDAGYHDQVLVSPSTSLLFVELEGARTPIRIQRELTGEITFRAGSHIWSSEHELAEWVTSNPARVTPNALLRPVLQDFLLPTIAYIAGPAELAYFAQSSVIYQSLLGSATPVLPRISATILEPRIAQLLHRYGVSVRDVIAFHSQQELATALACRSQSATITQSFADAQSDLQAHLQHLSTEITAEDPSLSGAAQTATRKIAYQLEKLKNKAARARLRREQEIARHAQLLWNNLRPRHQLQEREICAAHYLLKYGTDFASLLPDKLSNSCAGHQIIAL